MTAPVIHLVGHHAPGVPSREVLEAHVDVDHWALVPIPHGEKAPKIDGWQKLRITRAELARYFPPSRPMNVGVILGSASGGLADVDLDCAETIDLAPDLLPPSLAFGRASKPRSHRFYRSPGAITRQFRDPAGTGKAMLVELRSEGESGEGVQTVIPSSVHSNEIVEWDADAPTEPREIEAGELRALVEKLAAGALLVRNGWTRDAALAFVRAPVDDPRLADLMPRVGAKIREWLGIAPPVEQRPQRAPISVDVEMRKRRARAYLDKIDGAVEGQGGHDQTWRAALAVAVGFDLGELDALELLTAYNARCEPPWSERELHHKITDAASKSKLARGYLLGEERTGGRAPSRASAAPRDEAGGDGASEELVEELVEDETPSDRRVIIVRPDIAGVVDETEAALVAGDFGIYVRARTIVRVGHDGGKIKGITRAPGAPVIEAIAGATLRELAGRAADFIKRTKKEKDDGDGNLVEETVDKRTLPPSFVADTLLVRGEWGFPELEAVVEAPTMRADGSILERPGYDRASGLLFEPSTTFPPVPDRPSLADAQRARAQLDDIFVDFPFVGPEDKAAALAAMFTIAARPAIAGPCPMFVARAPVPGAGKGLVIDAIAIVPTGRAPARMVAPRDDDETRKALLAIGMEAPPVVLVDNLDGAFGSAAFAAALTLDTYTARQLGANRMVTVPLRPTWLATGNNITFKGDLGRRVVPIDLDPHVEHPEDRHGFRHPDLLAHVRQHRPRLLVAALTILRGFHVAGRPRHGMPRVGSFESWDDLVRAACVWVGLGDPAAGRQRIRQEGDQDLDLLRDALATWDAAFGEFPLTIVEAVERSERFPELHAALTALCPRDDLTPRALGYVLRRMRGRIVDGRRFEHAGEQGHDKVRRWRVRCA